MLWRRGCFQTSQPRLKYVLLRLIMLLYFLFLRVQFRFISCSVIPNPCRILFNHSTRIFSYHFCSYLERRIRSPFFPGCFFRLILHRRVMLLVKLFNHLKAFLCAFAANFSTLLTVIKFFRVTLTFLCTGVTDYRT